MAIETTTNEEFLVQFAEENNIPVEVARKLVEKMGAQAQEAALKAYAGQKRKEGEIEREEFKLKPIEPGTTIYLSEILFLDEVPIEDASEAMRALNPDTVEQYQAVYLNTPDVMPAVKVTGTTWGYLNLDGRHRLVAQDNNLKARFQDKDGKWINGGKESYKKAKAEYVVKWEEVVCDDFMGAVAYAFRANMANGLQMGKNNRVRYALWLQRQAEKLGSSMNDRDAAKAAGLLVHSGLVNMRTRLAQKIAATVIEQEAKGIERKNVKMPADVTLMPAGFDRKVTEEIKKLKKEPVNHLEKPTETLFKSMAQLCDLLNDSEALARGFVEFFVNNESNVQNAEVVIDALQIAIDASDSVIDEEADNEQAEKFAMAELVSEQSND